MKSRTRDHLFTSGNRILSLGVDCALLAVQWKQGALPAAVVATVLMLTVAKSCLLILDFLGHKDMTPKLALPLYTF